MNDTHTFEPIGDEPPRSDTGRHPVDDIAALDPADAPAAAERYAMELAAELEAAGAAPPDPVQLQADLGDGSDSGPDDR